MSVGKAMLHTQTHTQIYILDEQTHYCVGLTSHTLETDICTIVNFSFIYYKHGFLICKIIIT